MFYAMAVLDSVASYYAKAKNLFSAVEQQIIHRYIFIITSAAAATTTSTTTKKIQKKKIIIFLMDFFPLRFFVVAFSLTLAIFLSFLFYIFFWLPCSLLENGYYRLYYSTILCIKVYTFIYLFFYSM